MALDTKFQSQYIPYSDTGKFTKIVSDYINEAPALKDFYEHHVNIEGIKSAIAQRKKYATNRRLLVDELTHQYKDLKDCDAIQSNINELLSESTFTICTAHQPNIFTGHLYFIYKILHIIKLADTLKKELPAYNFVPVFFIGSEDADLEELNHIVIDREKYTWETSQTGAVGRMIVDDNLIKLIEKISGRLSVEKYGNDLIELLQKCYTKNTTIENATFLFVHHLFKAFGLLILLPDNPLFKNEMVSVFEDDIFNHTSSEIVNQTSEKLSKNYKAQAYPREINLFYLKDNLRNRIVQVDDHFVVHDTNITFSKEEIKKDAYSVFHLGAMDWQPNIDGLNWFLENVWPKVQAVHPDVKLYLAGRKMGDRFSGLESRNIVAVGEVENAQAFMRSRGLMIAPLLSGGGMRVKLVEGMALEKVIVTTRVVAEGVEAEDEKELLIADSADGFAEKVNSYLKDPDFLSTVGKNAGRLAAAHYNNADISKRLTHFYNSLRTK